MVLVVLPAAFVLAGLVIGRWWVVAFGLASRGGLAVFLDVNKGWYGHGWGDGGIAINMIAAAATVLGAVLGVGLRYAASGNARTRARA